MKKSVSIILVAIIYLFISSQNVYSQVESNLPSEETWNTIKNTTNATSVLDDQKPSLRAAPPGGPGIGETPIGESSLVLLILTGMVYIYTRRRKMAKQK